MRAYPALSCLVSLLFLACGEWPLAQVTRAPQPRRDALGVPESGFPSWSERMMLTLVNRARVDPQSDLADCTRCAEKACYTPVSPIGYGYALNRAARFHSGNLTRTQSRLQHDSPCDLVANISELYPPNGSCLGEAECACQGGSLGCQGSCPRFSSRTSLFGASARRENAASGGDPMYIFYLWLHEGDSDESCGWRYSNGHRYNILADDISAGGMGNDAWWTQDFGYGGEAGPLFSGAHAPQQGSASTSFAFRVSYADSAAPQRALLAIDGQCQPLSVERQSRGIQGFAASYIAESTVGAGCHAYVFVFETAAGEPITMPGSGAYGVGEAGCEDWLAERPIPDASCGACVPSCGDHVCGDDGCGGSCGSCGLGAACQSGACVALPQPDAGERDAATLDVDAAAADAALAGGDAGAGDGRALLLDAGARGGAGDVAEDSGQSSGEAETTQHSNVGQGLSCRALSRAPAPLWLVASGLLFWRRRRGT